MRAIADVGSDARIARVVDVVMRDLTRRLSRSEAARLANLESAYFSRRFHKVAGVGFAVWNRQVRVVAAQRLLVTTTLKIAAVANLVGYVDATTFERNFRKHAGMSPRMYRVSIGPKTQIADKKTQIADTKTRNAETSHTEAS